MGSAVNLTAFGWPERLEHGQVDRATAASQNICSFPHKHFLAVAFRFYLRTGIVQLHLPFVASRCALGLFALAATALAAESLSAQTVRNANPRLTGTPFLSVWQPDDYRAHPENTCVIQHPRTGLIYIGNGSGVLEFDGARWRLLPVPDGGVVNALAVDARGRIWGVTNGDIIRLEPDERGQLQVQSLRNRLPPRFQFRVLLARCIATPQTMYFADHANLIGFDLDDGPARIWKVAEGSAVVTLRLWKIGAEPYVMIGGNVVFRLRAGNLERVPGLRYTVCGAQAEPDGSWQLLTVAGTERWDGQTLTLKGKLPHTTGTQRAAFLADGRGVFATQQDGIVVCDRAGRVLQMLGRARGLPANLVTDVMADRDGGVWATYRNGIARVQLDSPYALHGPAQGVEGTIHSLARPASRFFAAGTEGLAERGPDGRFQPMPEADMPVRDIEAHGDWLFVESSTLLALRPAVDPRPSELENRNYYGILPLAGQPGWYVHGCNQGVRWARFEAGKWVSYGPVAAVNRSARVLLQSPEGIVWAGYSGAVRRIDFRGGLRPDAPVARFGRAEGLPTQPTAMFLLGEKSVALVAGRLLRFEEAALRFVPETRIAGMTALVGPEPRPSPIVHVHVSGDGTIWVQAGPPSGAIARLVADGAERWRVELLPGEPLRHLRPTTLFHEMETQTLWIGGHGALVSRDLTWQPTRSSAPPVAVVRRIETAAGELLFAGANGPAASRDSPPLRLPPHQDALRIQFAAPSFAPDHTGATHIEYRTRLEGLDRDWSAWSSQAERDLTNLPWRAFTFRVQARDDTGRASPETVLAFSIAPAWWATHWARTGYGVLGLLGIAGIVRLRTRALRRRADRLEQIVAERTRELAQSNTQLATQNTELARLHQLELDEKIAAQLAEEKARLELLRYQLNPHFLLNAFTTLRSLVFSSPEAAGKTVERLADFCRIALTRSDESSATVEAEVRLIESYLDTEKARWRDELQVELRIDPAARPLPLPAFLLQPLVENAIKYGGRTSPGTLQIRVSIACDEDGLAIEVANTGEWVGANSPHRQGSTGIGMENLHQRLRRLYRDAHEFRTEAHGGWVFVRLKLKQPAGALTETRRTADPVVLILPSSHGTRNSIEGDRHR